MNTNSNLVLLLSLFPGILVSWSVFAMLTRQSRRVRIVISIGVGFAITLLTFYGSDFAPGLVATVAILCAMILLILIVGSIFSRPKILYWIWGVPYPEGGHAQAIRQALDYRKSLEQNSQAIARQVVAEAEKSLLSLPHTPTVLLLVSIASLVILLTGVLMGRSTVDQFQPDSTRCFFGFIAGGLIGSIASRLISWLVFKWKKVPLDWKHALMLALALSIAFIAGWLIGIAQVNNLRTEAVILGVVISGTLGWMALFYSGLPTAIKHTDATRKTGEK